MLYQHDINSSRMVSQNRGLFANFFFENLCRSGWFHCVYWTKTQNLKTSKTHHNPGPLYVGVANSHLHCDVTPPPPKKRVLLCLNIAFRRTSSYDQLSFYCHCCSKSSTLTVDVVFSWVWHGGTVPFSWLERE